MSELKVRMYIDGASRGNPGEASIGVSFCNLQGEELHAFGEFIGKETNNTAEYTALIRGLEVALEKKYKSLMVFSDSQLMVRQIMGQYKVKTPHIKVLFIKAKDLQKRFESFEIEHVRRELNTRADELANIALNEC